MYRIFCSKYTAITKTASHGGRVQLSRIEEFYWIQITRKCSVLYTLFVKNTLNYRKLLTV
jgi:hypothetical protein